MVSTKDKLEFVYVMAHHSSVPLGALYRVMRLASTYQRIMELHCNGNCPYRHSHNDVCIKSERIRQRIEDELDPYLCKPCFQGDPRGCCVKVIVPDGCTNDMGQEGICVPA